MVIRSFFFLFWITKTDPPTFFFKQLKYSMQELELALCWWTIFDLWNKFHAWKREWKDHSGMVRVPLMMEKEFSSGHLYKNSCLWKFHCLEIKRLYEEIMLFLSLFFSGRMSATAGRHMHSVYWSDSYTFRQKEILCGIGKCRELSPGNRLSVYLCEMDAERTKDSAVSTSCLLSIANQDPFLLSLSLSLL